MAKEIYAFNMGFLEQVPSDPRAMHPHIRNRLDEMFPILGTFTRRYNFSYFVVSVYQSGYYDVNVFIMLDDKGDATLFKTVMP